MATHGNTSYEIKQVELSPTQKRKYSDNLEKHADNHIIARQLDEFVFATARAVDVGDYYASVGSKPSWEHCVNANGDYFDYTEIMDLHPIKNVPRYKTFANRGFYRNHQSDKIENAIGFVFDSVLNVLDSNNIIISCLIGVDKHKAPDVARTLLTYPDKQGVSMGCTIKHSICTVCEHSTEYGTKCEHLTRYTNRRDPKTGILTAEMVKGVDFFELSGVTNPAFAFSYVLDVIKDWVPGTMLRVAQETKNQKLFNMISVFAHINKRLASADKSEKLVFNAKLDQIIFELENAYGLRV
jgi:hypothetical protein